MNPNKMQPHKDEQEVSATRIVALDTAILLTLCSSLLYILGWTYWDSFFKYFGVSIEFADVNFNQIVATTWWIVVPFIFFLLQFDYGVVKSGNLNQLSIRIHNILIITSFIFGAVAFILSLPFWVLATGVLSGSIVIALCIELFHLDQKRIQLGSFVQTKHQRLVILFIFIIVAILIYSYLGHHRAKLLSKGQNTAQRITIKSTSGGILIKDAIFVSHMDSKYFVCSPTLKDERPELLIIEDNQVESVSIKEQK